MGAAKAITKAVGKTVNKGIRTVTGNPKAAPTVRMAAAPGVLGKTSAASAPAPVASTASVPSTSSVPSTNSFGGIISTSDNSADSGRRSSGSIGLAEIPNTEVASTEPEREEDTSINVKSPGIEADDEEKRRDAVEKANEYMMSSENY